MGTGEVMPADFDGVFGRKPLLAGIIVVADEFFLLGVHRNDRPSCRQGSFNAGVDMAELGIPVGVAAAFLCLAIALQAVVLLVEQLGHLHMADRMLLPAQLQGNGPRALTNPAQGRFRIPTRFTSNQLIQCAQKMRIRDGEVLAPRTCPTNMTLHGAVSCVDLANTLADRLARQSTSPVNDRHSAITQADGFVGRHDASRSLIQQRPHSTELSRQRCLGIHGQKSCQIPACIATFIY